MKQDFDTTSRVVMVDLAEQPKVLVVDDDEMVLAHLQSVIEAAGFKVSTARSAAAALSVLNKSFAPIVILDRNMA